MSNLKIRISELIEKIEKTLILTHKLDRQLDERDREKINSYRKQLLDLKDPISKEIKIAFIGEQSTGKSSIINSIIDIGLPQGENGLDCFITEITYRTDGDFINSPDIVAELTFQSGETTRLNECDLKDLFDNLKDSDDKKDFFEIKKLVIYKDDPFLKGIRIVNTPGINNTKDYYKMVENIVQESSSVFWVLDARTTEHMSVEKNLRSMMSGVISKTYGILNKVDIYLNDDNSIEKIKDKVNDIQEFYKGMLSSVVVYSDNQDMADVLGIVDFRSQITTIISQEYSKKDSLIGKVENAEALFRGCISGIKEILEKNIDQLRNEQKDIIEINQINRDVFIPNYQLAKNGIQKICSKHIGRMRKIQEPIIISILDDEIRTFNSLWRGVAGIFNKNVSLKGKIQSRVKDEMKAEEETISAIFNDLIFDLEDVFNGMAKEINADVADLSEGKQVSVKASGNAKIHSDLPYIPDTILKSFLKSMQQIFGKELANKLVKIIQQKIEKTAAEKGGQKVAKEVTKKASETVVKTASKKAAGKGSEQAGKLALGQILKDVVSYWLLVTLPIDILDLIKEINTARESAKASIPSWFDDHVEDLAESYSYMFYPALSEIRDEAYNTLKKLVNEEDQQNRTLQDAISNLEQMEKIIDDIMDKENT